ncbi:ATP-grasp domain-containing protein [Viridibacillus sp. YIM B01967]|uniref:ATP-grasp domain-containing protein n=1 Tax=Viridibacillus soli TaxID=2798301 RepID=A0ABS1H5R5_9BACL|nr:biotin carboxylase N-terminal domain-containing protein [Viridibacillus soli]MBK3494502.1 ATP-grasp domain-containing protein [Viridibacillus soli]
MRKVLIANRGEIARRIIATCHRLGIETVAIYSDADQDLPFVKEATTAIRIGENRVDQSYLKADAIIQLAVEHQVSDIHPGYGLLSENADFARKVVAAGIRWIGPNADIIEQMGDKIQARQTMKNAGVPVVPGSDEGLTSLDEALQFASLIGYPVMLKASAGGGGIGMVCCEGEQALSRSFENVKKRAQSYFNNDQVFIEKYIPNARHIEVQIFGDDDGNVVHLFERNCSIQRRHQKVIEESPSPNFPKAEREQLLQAAVDAAKAVHYTNAGTVEFIVDAENHFYFLEMNTRLQVEHPVTEAITGFDLVEWQLVVAEGKKLPVIDQKAIESKGHAIEYRIYAEDPEKFLPSPGKLQVLMFPQVDHSRIDSGYVEGNSVSPFYDPLIAKLIVFGETREQALTNSQGIVKETVIQGVKSNLLLFERLLQAEMFQSGVYHTSSLTEWLANQKGEMIHGRN